MPWIIDKNGDQQYKVSIYAKEELPTWSEIYNEFYINNYYYFDPKNPDHQIEDSYWKIPHRKYLLTMICNQFNKTLFEDKYNKLLLYNIKEHIFSYNYTPVDIRFTCSNLPIQQNVIIYNRNMYNSKIDSELFDNSSDKSNVWDNDYDYKNINPPIYTIPLPTGKPNPFIISKTQRIDVKSLTDKLELYPIIRIIDENSPFKHFIYTPKFNKDNIDSIESLDWKFIIDFIVSDYSKYFLKNKT